MPHVWVITGAGSGAGTYPPHVGSATVAPMKQPFVLAVFGGKGGIGKTTTAVALAWLYAMAGLKVLLIDANAEQPSAYDLYTDYRQNVDVPYEITVEERPELLGNVKKLTYDVVIIDCPPSPTEAKAALDTADLVLVPFVPLPMETKAIARTIRATLADRPYLVLFVSVSTHRKFAGTERLTGRAEQAHEMLEGFGVPVMKAFVRRYSVHHTAVANGVPTFSDEARAWQHGQDAADDYQAVYAELQTRRAA